MKKVLSLVAAAGLIAASTAAFGGTIVNSKHDLSNATGGGALKGANTQICIYCHAPHASTLVLPLWNRNNPVETLFTLYSGINMASRQFATGFTADSTSLFCMSCHDGVTGMEDVHNEGALIRNAAAGQAGNAGLALAAGPIMEPTANLGYNLTNTHPVNFPVPTTDFQTDLHIGSGQKMGGIIPATSVATLKDYTNAFPLFNAGKIPALTSARNTDRSLECGSCHAVHDSQYSPFLRATMDGSALCLGCHNK